jgi:lipoprotein-anchoring transpeptidase ErfK/SrfK
MGAQYDLGATVDTAYNVGRSWPLPIVGLLSAKNKGSIGYAYKIDSRQLSKFTDSVVNSVGRDPINASLQINDGVISVVPDQDGLRIDDHYLDNVLTTALADGKDQTISLEPVTKKADILPGDTSAAQAQASDFLNRQITLTYNGKTFTADRTALGHMITFSEINGPNGKPQLQASIDRNEVLGYLQSVSNQVSVAPTNRKVIVLNGVETETQAGQNGTTIDQQTAADAVYNALSQNQNATIALQSTSVPFSTVYQRPDGAIGGLNYPKYIEVNLSTQRLFAWQNGQIVLTAPTVTGKDSAPTVTGVFAIYTKERNRYLNGAAYGYDYNVFVQYWMPFYQGFGLHDASWRPTSWFGDQAFHYNGSHGCVNLWTSTAAYLYDWAPVGTPVWIHF